MNNVTNANEIQIYELLPEDIFPGMQPNLPMELIYHIFSMMAIKDLAVLALVSKKWHVFTDLDFHWNPLCKGLPIKIPHDRNWKAAGKIVANLNRTQNKLTQLRELHIKHKKTDEEIKQFQDIFMSLIDQSNPVRLLSNAIMSLYDKQFIHIHNEGEMSEFLCGKIDSKDWVKAPIVIRRHLSQGNYIIIVAKEAESQTMHRYRLYEDFCGMIDIFNRNNKTIDSVPTLDLMFSHHFQVQNTVSWNCATSSLLNRLDSICMRHHGVPGWKNEKETKMYWAEFKELILKGKVEKDGKKISICTPEELTLYQENVRF